MMKTILVSGASGIVGYGILRSLRNSGKDLRLVGTTIYDDSVAQGFCDIFEQAPHTDDASYIGWLLHMIDKHQIDLLIPGIEADVYKWVDHISEIEGRGSKALLNNIELISLCKDKWVFYESLSKAGLPYAIETSLNADFNVLADRFGLPFLLKPRCGFGSKGIVRVDSVRAFAPHQSDVGSVIIAQPIVGNEESEYTISAFCDGAGGFYASMTLRRTLSKDGFTDRAEVVSSDNINAAVSALCRHFNPVGPTNFQFRKHGDELKLLEINPRISSATSIRTAFGYNEALMSIEYHLGNRKPQQPVIRRGRAVRYMEDFIFYEDRPDI